MAKIEGDDFDERRECFPIGKREGSAPNYVNGRRIVNVPAGGTAIVGASESVDVYVCSSSNAATTSIIAYQGFAY